jgi:hypothetical protein
VKVKVKCLGVLACALEPTAVLVADAKVLGEVQRYVWLTYDERAALWDFERQLARDRLIPEGGFLRRHDAQPGRMMLRAHSFDAETGQKLDAMTPELRLWLNAEGAWVRADLYEPIATELVDAWRQRDPASQYAAGPSWLALTVVRKLIMAMENKGLTGEKLRRYTRDRTTPETMLEG